MEIYIKELQQMSINTNADIEELLRKAYIVAIKFKQSEMQEWILNEQNGYRNEKTLPSYRFLRGELKAYNHGGWIPTHFNRSEQAELFSNMPIMEPISGIVEAYKNSKDVVSYSINDEITEALNTNGSFVTVYNFFTSTGELKKIFSSIQNKILNWTIELEQKEQERIYNMGREISLRNEEKSLANEIDIFLSYCWADENVADEIYFYFKDNKNIEIHRDLFDIKKWGSIKEYMQSISNMDYTILLISDAYLKSANCMYEVLEVMRERNYKNKIFPAIVYSGIYDPFVRAEYVKYWENESEKLEEALKGIRVQNLGKLPEDLKRRQNIAANIAEFLDVVSDMNNPRIQEVTLRIEEKLNEKGLLENNQEKKEKKYIPH